MRQELLTITHTISISADGSHSFGDQDAVIRSNLGLSAQDSYKIEKFTQNVLTAGTEGKPELLLVFTLLIEV